MNYQNIITKIAGKNPTDIQRPDTKDIEEKLSHDLFRDAVLLKDQFLTGLHENLQDKAMIKKSINLLNSLSKDLQNFLNFKFPENQDKNLSSVNTS